MDTGRQDEQHVGDNMPEGTQCVERQIVSRRGTNVFRSRTTMSGRTGRTDDKAEDRKRDVGKGDRVWRIWRKPGEGDFTGGGMDFVS